VIGLKQIRACIIVLVLLTGTSAIAQNEDGNSQKAELCTVEGTVVSAATGEPLKSAMLSLLSLQPLGEVTAFTDEHGHFVFKEVSPGNYLFRAIKQGYLEQSYHPEPAGPAQRLDLQPGQKIEHAVFRLARPGVILGRVVDEQGEPLAHVEMEALILKGPIAKPRYGANPINSVQRVWTDDLGAFRLFDLPPGSYYVRATDSGYMGLTRMGPWVNRIDINGHPPMYFPGVSRLRDAQKINVRGGQEVRIDLALRAEKTYSISGKISGKKGRSVGAYLNVVLSEYGAKDGSGFSTLALEAFTNENGDFQFQTVSPGAYVIWAIQKDADAGYWALQHVDVSDRDVTGLQLQMLPEVEIAGRVEMAEGAKPDLEQIRLEFRMDGDREMAASSDAAVQKDGTFKQTGMVRTRYSVEVTGLSAGWYVSNMTYASQDVLERGLDLGGDTNHLLIVKLSSRSARLTGMVVQRGRPVHDAVVRLAPSTARLPASNLVTFTGKDGQFTIEGVPPGSYRVVVVLPETDSPVEADGSDGSPSVAVVLGEKESKTMVIELDNMHK